jgi:hypothetical protein
MLKWNRKWKEMRRKGGNRKGSVTEKEVRIRREAGAVEVEVEVGRVMGREKRTDVGM